MLIYQQQQYTPPPLFLLHIFQLKLHRAINYSYLLNVNPDASVSKTWHLQLCDTPF